MSDCLLKVVEDLAHTPPLAWDHAGPYCVLCDHMQSSPKVTRNFKQAARHADDCPFIRARHHLAVWKRNRRKLLKEK